jgi:hypothetical protein
LVETVLAQSKGKKPTFFCLEETDYICWYFTSIVPQNDEIHLQCDDPKVKADWENGNHSMRRSDTVHRDDAIVLQLADATYILLARANLLASILPALSVTSGKTFSRRCGMKGSHTVGIGISTVPNFTCKSK